MNQAVYKQKICTLIKEIRMRKGIKQEVVALAIGKNQGTYSRMESGAIEITPAELKMICALLDVSNLKIIAQVDSDMANTPMIKGTPYCHLLISLICHFEEIDLGINSEEELLKQAIYFFQSRLNPK